jgi:hypothetical protein
MIRLAWRQFRTQAAVAIGGLVAVAVVVAITGRQLVDLYNTTVASCLAPADCGLVNKNFVAHDSFLQTGLGALLLLVPALIGVFWGAPLIARELETGTYRLVWTQGVTRTRWLAVKVGLVGLASMAVGGLLSLMVTWWFNPIDAVNLNRFVPGVFDARGIVAIGYAAFAFALGVTAGLLLRRTVPAMATTLVAFVVVRLAILAWIRPNLIAPVNASMALSSSSGLGFGPGPAGITVMADPPSIPNGWALSSQIVDSAGQAPTDQSLHDFLSNACPSIAAPAAAPSNVSHGPANPAVFQDCIAQLSAKFHLAVLNQPADRYWTFQWYETAIFLGLALVLAGFCFWGIRRRLA